MSRAVGNSGSVREVRSALVCYGGVSLAIYMYGVTRELHRLVTASSRFDDEQKLFEPSCSPTPRSKLDLVDAGHFTWEVAPEEYAEIVTGWWAGGQARA
jgi:pimeloyl-ACP methyl ester carboxylesterase